MSKIMGLIGRKRLVIGGLAVSIGALGIASWLLIPNTLVAHEVLSRLGMEGSYHSERPAVQVPVSQKDGIERALADDQAYTLSSSKSDLIHAVRNMLAEQSGLAFGKVGVGAKLKESMGLVQAVADKADVRHLTIEECDAAAVYVLSGGAPGILERIVAEVELDKGRRGVFEGAIAFVKGDLKVAATKLAASSAPAFEPILAARIYMLQAQLTENAPYESRQKMLETAANLAIGTLFEEAATRRLVALAAKNGAVGDLRYWADRYERRFSDSLYFSEFWGDLLDGIFAFERHPGRLKLESLHGLVFQLRDDHRVAFVRQLILRAIKEGQPRLCQFGFNEAADSSGKTSETVEELRLYRLVCAIGSSPESVGPELALLDRKKLNQNEIELLQSADLLAQGVLAKSSAGPKEAEIYGPRPAYPGVEAVRARAASVAQQLDATDSILKRAEK